MYRRSSQAFGGPKLHSNSRRLTDDRKDALAYDGDSINVLQMVHDAFYYMGFMQIAKYALFLVMGIILLLFHVNTINSAPNTTYFRTSITNKLATTPFPDQDGPSWDDVDSFYGAAVYYRDTMERMINASTDAGIPEPTVTFGEYGKVVYARIIANFEENCKLERKWDGVECWRGAETGAGNTTTNVTSFFKLGPPYGPPHDAPFDYNIYDHWHTTYSRYFFFRAGSDTRTNWQALVTITVDPNTTRDEFLKKIKDNLSDLHLQLLGRYTYILGLDIIAQNTLSKDGHDDYAIFSLRVQRSGKGSGNVDRGAFNKLSVTTPGRRELYASKSDRGRRLVEIIFWVIFFWVAMLDVVQFKLARRQGTSLYSYFSHFWNSYNWLVNLALIGWLVAYFILWVAWSQFYNSTPWPLVPNTCNDFYRYEVYSAYYARWVYSGIGLLVFLGLRMVQFSRLHPGVQVFHQVLGKSLRDLMDFLAVFVYLLVLLGTAVFLIFQMNGGNFNWLTWWDGASVLSRLAFQQAGYEDMYNAGIGSGTSAFVITAIFWICIATLFVFSGNIFLSAVSYAYGATRDQNPQVETFFVVEILYRIVFGIGWIGWMLFGYRSFEKSHQSIKFLRGSAGVPKNAPPPGLNPSPSGSSGSDPETGSPASPPGGDGGEGEGALRDQTETEGGPQSPGGGAGGGKLGESLRVVAQKGGEHAAGAYRQLVDSLFHKADVNYYRMFMPKDPARHPRLYMLARWALASRPEVRALATHFVDFRKFRLATATRRRNKDSLYDPFHLPPLRHIPVLSEGESVAPLDWDNMDEGELVALLKRAKESHERLLEVASIYIILPSWLTKLFLGYFWMDYHTSVIPSATSAVYDPKYMKQIESSFAIDEDEALALPTITDLRNEVEAMEGKLKETMLAAQDAMRVQQEVMRAEQAAMRADMAALLEIVKAGQAGGAGAIGN